MCEKAHALRLQFEFEKSRWLSKIKEDEADVMRFRDTRSFAPFAERKSYYSADSISEKHTESEESDRLNFQDSQNGQSNLSSSENNQFIYDTTDEMLSVDHFDQDSSDAAQNLIVAMSDDDAADQTAKRKRKFTTPSKGTLPTDISKPVECDSSTSGATVPVATRNSMIDDMDQEQWHIDDNSGADFGGIDYYDYQQDARNEASENATKSAIPLRANITPYESVNIDGIESTYDNRIYEDNRGENYEYEMTISDREQSYHASASQEFQEESVSRNDDELLTLNMFVTGTAEHSHGKATLAESRENQFVETLGPTVDMPKTNNITENVRISKHGTTGQAGDINTAVDGTQRSSQRGLQIDSLYSSSQSADTTAAAPHLVHDSITADEHLTTEQIDSHYSSSQSADTTAAAPHLVHDSITADEHLTTARIDSHYSSSQSADTTAT